MTVINMDYDVEQWIRENYDGKKAGLLIAGGAASSDSSIGLVVYWEKPDFQSLRKEREPVDIDMNWICELALKHRVSWFEMWLAHAHWLTWGDEI